jgi:hypothetical protein
MFSRETLTEENILKHIQNIYERNYNAKDMDPIKRIFDDVIDLFQGRRPGYQACDAQYHNLTHTFQTIPPFVEIVDGWNKSGQTPRISKEFFRFGVIGVLLHDTGYIKTQGDTEGTGAKYTFTHMQRSIEFADGYLKDIGFDNKSVTCILNIIGCTGVTLDMNIHFFSEEERLVGYALGTADLLGQMSDEDYLDKIPILYKEFAEAYRYEGLDKLRERGSVIAASAEDLIKGTPGFYEKVALTRFKLLGSMHEYAQRHHGTPENPYLAAIERNMERIRTIWCIRP